MILNKYAAIQSTLVENILTIKIAPNNSTGIFTFGEETLSLFTVCNPRSNTTFSSSNTELNSALVVDEVYLKETPLSYIPISIDLSIVNTVTDYITINIIDSDLRKFTFYLYINLAKGILNVEDLQSKSNIVISPANALIILQLSSGVLKTSTTMLRVSEKENSKYYRSKSISSITIKDKDNVALSLEIDPVSGDIIYTGKRPITPDYSIIIKNNSEELTFTVNKLGQIVEAAAPVVKDTTSPTLNNPTIDVSNISDTSIKLSWIQAADNKTGSSFLEYAIYYSLKNDINTIINCETNGVLFQNYTKNLSSVIVTSLSENTLYYFNVVVKDTAGNKTCYSATKHTTSMPLPGNKGVLTVTDLRSTHFRLNWVAGQDCSTSKVKLKYAVYSSTKDDIYSVETCLKNGTLVTDFTENINYIDVTGLLEAHTYYFNVLVQNEKEYSNSYNIIKVNTVDLTAPVVGGSGTLTCTDIKDTSLTLNWVKSADNGTTETQLVYTIFKSSSNNITTYDDCRTNGTVVESITGSTSYTINNLIENTKYYFNVVVKDLADNISCYKTTSATTLITTDIIAPVISGSSVITTTDCQNTSVKLSWNTSTDNHAASQDLLYAVYQSLTDNIDTIVHCEANGTVIQNYTTELSYLTVSNLIAGKTYYFNVIVKDIAGNKTCYTSKAYTTDIPVPGNNGIVTAEQSNYDVILKWTKGTDPISKSTDLEYAVYQSLENNIDNLYGCINYGKLIQNYTKDSNQLTISYLKENTKYYFNVLIRNPLENTVAYVSTNVIFLPVSDTIAPVVGGSGTLTCTDLQKNSLVLNWVCSTDSKTAQKDLVYEIYQSATDNIKTVATCIANGTKVKTTTGLATSCTISALQENHTYYFNIIVKDRAGNSSCYTSITQLLPDKTAPTPGDHGIVTLTATSNTAVTLTWKAATDNITAQEKLQYAVYSTKKIITNIEECEKDGNVIKDYTENLLTVGVNSLAQGIVYYFNVIVKDLAGNKAFYNVATYRVPTASTSTKKDNSSSNKLMLAAGAAVVGGAAAASLIASSLKSNIANESSPRIFGTFPPEGGKNLSSSFRKTSHYSDFERKRDDGTFIIDLVPEVRVFVYGGEVTKDVLSVDIQYRASDASTCTIVLSNPRGKYEISRQDLLGKWREDKDISATYTYDWLKRQETPKASILNVAKTIVGNDVASLVKQVASLGIQTPLVNGNISRMVYETKFKSGFTKYIGDLVFDMRDPVYVFMKGRYSSFWYFAFSGMINSFDSSDIYGQDQTVTLTCGDLLSMLQRKKVTQKGALISAGNIESSVMNSEKGQTTSLFKNILGAGSVKDIVKRVIYGSSGSMATNCYPPDFAPIAILGNKSVQTLDNFKQVYTEFLKKRKDFNMDNKPGYMFTYNDSGMQETGMSLAAVKKFFTGETSKDPYSYESAQFKKEMGHPNSGKFSAWLPLYFQYNEILPEKFNGEFAKNAYNCTLRYWEKNFVIKKGANDDKTMLLNKWESESYYGVAGIHPALRYEFINNFNILTNIWGFYSYNPKVTDALEMTMHDKILESVAGSAKESKGYANLNYFRPRFFLMYPERWRGQAPGNTSFGEFLLAKADVTTAYDVLSNLAEKMEFKLFSSPMGDIFLEPSMHDLHPLEFWENIEDRNILKKDTGAPGKQGIPINFRLSLYDDNADNTCTRTDRAYFFNSDANHPFFFMEKDRERISTTFNPQNVKTSTTVVGSVVRTTDGRITDIFTPEFNEEMTIYSLAGNNSSGASGKADNKFAAGLYIADGFTNKVRGSSNQFTLDVIQSEKFLNKKNDYEAALEEIITAAIIDKYKKSTLKSLILETVAAVLPLVNSYGTLEDTAIDQLVYDPKGSGLEDLVGLLYQQKALLDKSTGKYNLLYKEYLVIDIMCHDIYVQIANSNSNKSTSNTPVDQPTAQTASDVNNWESTAIVQKTVIEYVPALKEYEVNKEKVDLVNNKEYQGIRNLVFCILKSSKESQFTDVLQLILNLVQSFKETQEGVLYKLSKLGKPVTLADYKMWAAAGLYNHKDNIVHRYGFNPAPTYINYFVDNGKDAAQYARVYFNRLFGEAYVNNISVIGRPEVFLNRPYYVEKKDCIGTLNSYKLSFSVGSAFMLHGELTHIRKNALTFNYSNGDIDNILSAEVPQDSTGGIGAASALFSKLGIGGGTAAKVESVSRKKIVGGTKVNNYFSSQAAAYYNDLYGKSLSKLLDNTVGSAISSVAGKNTGLDFWNAGKPAGGLYSAHDWLGHLSYELDAYKDCGGTTKKILKFLCNDISNPEQVNEILMICWQLQSRLKELQRYEEKIDELQDKYLEVTDNFEKKQKEIEQKQNEKASTVDLTSEAILLYNEQCAIVLERDGYRGDCYSIAESIYGSGFYSTSKKDEENYSNFDLKAKGVVSNRETRRKPGYFDLQDGSKFTEGSLFYNLKTALDKLSGDTKVKYTYMDDRAGASIEKWVVGKIETPIYIKKVICNPETTVPKVKEPEVYYMFLNFDYKSYTFESNLSVEYPYTHKNKRNIVTPQTASGISTTNAKELEALIAYIVTLSDTITKITIQGHCSKQWQKGATKSVVEKKLQVLSENRAAEIKRVLAKRLKEATQKVTDSPMKTAITKALSLVNSAKVEGKSYYEGYFDNDWLKLHYQGKIEDGIKYPASGDVADPVRRQSKKVGAIDQRVELYFTYKDAKAVGPKLKGSSK